MCQFIVGANSFAEILTCIDEILGRTADTDLKQAFKVSGYLKLFQLRNAAVTSNCIAQCGILPSG